MSKLIGRARIPSEHPPQNPITHVLNVEVEDQSDSATHQAHVGEEL